MSEFVLVPHSEPHARRRKELLARYPQIRALMGYDRRTAVVTALVVLSQLVIAGLFGAFADTRVLGSPWLMVPVAYVVGGTLTHWLSMAVHETSHRAAAKTRLGNDLVALLANVPMILPVAMTFKRYHLGHHRDLGMIGRDTDLPLDVETRWVANHTWRKALWLVLHPLIYMLRGLTFAKPFNRAELFNIALIVLIDVAIWRLLGPTAFAYLALSFFFGHSLHPVAAHFVHEHFTFAPGQETFSYYGRLNAVTFNVGYHNEHHDFMNIPGSRLPALRAMVPEYDELVSHTSWTLVLWRFITDRTIGYGSRIVREPRPLGAAARRASTGSISGGTNHVAA